MGIINVFSSFYLFERGWERERSSFPWLISHITCKSQNWVRWKSGTSAGSLTSGARIQELEFIILASQEHQQGCELQVERMD